MDDNDPISEKITQQIIMFKELQKLKNQGFTIVELVNPETGEKKVIDLNAERKGFER